MEWTECQHPTRKLGYREYAHGGRAYQRQCQTCGHCTTAIAKRDLSAQELATAEPLDETLQTRWWESQCAERQRLRETERQEFFDRHNDYLNSSQWQIKRGYVLARDKHACQARLHGCQGRATQVHHLTYEHWGDEPLWELTSVCKACHERVTEMDRARRGVAA